MIYAQLWDAPATATDTQSFPSARLIGIAHIGHDLPAPVGLFLPHGHVFAGHGNRVTFAALARKLPGSDSVA